MDYGARQYKNRILASLTPMDLEAISVFLEPVSLPRLFYLEKANTPINDLYFPERGIVSTVALIGLGGRSKLQ